MSVNKKMNKSWGELCAVSHSHSQFLHTSSCRLNSADIRYKPLSEAHPASFWKVLLSKKQGECACTSQLTPFRSCPLISNRH